MKENNHFYPSIKLEAVFSLLLAASQIGCNMQPTRPKLTSTNTPHSLMVESPTIDPATLIPSYPPILTETTTISPEPTRGWEIPNTETWISLLKNQDFLNQIVIDQFDLNQYESLDPQYNQEFLDADYPGNSCGEAVIAELLKLFTYRKTGEVSNITIADVINELLNKTSLIQANGTNMTDLNLKRAIDHFGQENDLFSTVSLTSYCGGICTSAIPGSDWSRLFRVAEENVLNRGGVLVAFVQKGGNPPGSLGHFMIISSFNSGGETLIIDTLDGSVRVIGLGAYVSVQPGLLSLIGVIPTP